MALRCPYCKKELEGMDPPPKCPACGKTMIVPKHKRPSASLERARRLARLEREAEAARPAVSSGAFARMLRHGGKFYVGLVLGLAFLAGVVFRAADSAVARRARNPVATVMGQLDILAEALGRFKFHCGRFPTAEEGLAALAGNPRTAQGWNGPYISHLRRDVWNTPYIYRPEELTNGLPMLYSCGPDAKAGTKDDVFPDWEKFDPGTDWTNGWVEAERRRPFVRVLKEMP